ncbi:MAG: hypothetical protein ABIO14_14260 [Aeromicrobium sp.]
MAQIRSVTKTLLIIATIAVLVSCGAKSSQGSGPKSTSGSISSAKPTKQCLEAATIGLDSLDYHWNKVILDKSPGLSRAGNVLEWETTFTKVQSDLEQAGCAEKATAGTKLWFDYLRSTDVAARVENGGVLNADEFSTGSKGIATDRRVLGLPDDGASPNLDNVPATDDPLVAEITQKIPPLRRVPEDLFQTVADPTCGYFIGEMTTAQIAKSQSDYFQSTWNVDITDQQALSYLKSVVANACPENLKKF